MNGWRRTGRSFDRKERGGDAALKEKRALWSERYKRQIEGAVIRHLPRGALPGTESRPVRTRLVLRMVHQMRQAGRVEHCGEPDQYDDENERNRRARSSDRPAGGHRNGSR